MASIDPAWARAQDALWRDLLGSEITRWVGTDYSIGSDDEPEFLDDSSPFRQLSQLHAELSHGTVLRLWNYQNDEVFGVGLQWGDGTLPYTDAWSREADLRALPVGIVERLELHVDDSIRSEGDTIEVQLTIGGRELLVVAAEVVETRTGPTYAWGDESFFTFTDPAAAAEVEWISPRRYTVREIGDSTVSPSASG